MDEQKVLTKQDKELIEHHKKAVQSYKMNFEEFIKDKTRAFGLFAFNPATKNLIRDDDI